MAHAILSPSSAERWIHCPPSAVINAEAPRTDTIYTREGTLAHAVCELKGRREFLLMDMLEADAYNAEMATLRADELWQDEMDGYTDTWIDALRDIAEDYDQPPHVALEVQVDFSEYVPDGFGTADCLMIGKIKGVTTLNVIDFKYGKGVPVSSENNPQIMLYALGALLDYDAIYDDIETVRMTIVQPRIRSEPDSWELDAHTLLAWANAVVEPAAKLAIHGGGEFQEGDWCRFCAIRGSCRARAAANLAAAAMEFRLPPELSDSEIGEALELGQRLKSWLSDLEEYALGACLDGREIPGFKAVAGRSVRAWTDADAAFKAALAAGIPEAVLYERKPVTLAALEKTIGKRTFLETLGQFVQTPPGKPTLAKSDDRRPAITGHITAKQDFEEEE